MSHKTRQQNKHIFQTFGLSSYRNKIKNILLTNFQMYLLYKNKRNTSFINHLILNLNLNGVTVELLLTSSGILFGPMCVYPFLVKHSTISIRTKGGVGAPWNQLKPSSKIFYWPSKAVLLLWIFCVISVLFCYVFVCVCLLMPCGHLLKRTDLLALVCEV